MGWYDCYVIGEWLDKNNFNTNMICPISWIFKFLEEGDCVILTDLLGTNVRSKLQDHSNPCSAMLTFIQSWLSLTGNIVTSGFLFFHLPT